MQSCYSTSLTWKPGTGCGGDMGLSNVTGNCTLPACGLAGGVAQGVAHAEVSADWGGSSTTEFIWAMPCSAETMGIY